MSRRLRSAGYVLFLWLFPLLAPPPILSRTVRQLLHTRLVIDSLRIGFHESTPIGLPEEDAPEEGQHVVCSSVFVFSDGDAVCILGVVLIYRLCHLLWLVVVVCDVVPLQFRSWRHYWA